jgi:hypothetical protein
LVNEEKQIGSIQNSLLSLESIKFSSAISVFSNLNTFLDSISNSIDIDKNDISENMNKIIKRGNKDIDNYLKSCYLNPFETSYNCNNI